MALTNMTEAFLSQVNNPQCSYLVGGMLGTVFIFRLIFYIFIMLAMFKIVDRLAFEPLLEWVKNKIYKVKK